VSVGRCPGLGLEAASAVPLAGHGPDGCASSAGERAESLEDGVTYGGALIPDSPVTDDEARVHESPWLESERHPLELDESSHEQTGAHEEDERYGNLEDYESRAHPARCESSGASPRLAAQHVDCLARAGNQGGEAAESGRKGAVSTAAIDGRSRTARTR
jgi:hypothetical protein